MRHLKSMILTSVLVFVAASLAAQNSGMVYVEGGTFQMGSKEESDASPVHSVTVSSFYMSRAKITIDEWMDEIGVYPEGYEENRTGTRVPKINWKTTAVENVTWYDAILYCNRRSVSEGLTPCYASNGSKDAITYSKAFRTEFPNVTCDWSANGYRLPTEAEWEYAARDGKRQSASNYIGGNNAQKAMTAVTADGIAQMGAGCSEWCWDWYSSTYYAASGNANNP
ncbi:MAG: SUMF1/EgtB/PvdO family nonheme iron enzyme, partial [Treponema sp.]|nr:SUMF1/EgtB/PvdO family nonheme iron enzyme [Treponema sp.]